MTGSLKVLITNRVDANGRGWCFSARDFFDLGSYDAIRRTLARLTEVGHIKRLAAGMYYYPRHHDMLGELPVQIDTLVDAMMRAHQIRCQPSGAYAANLLGLSDQVPAKITILTDGPTKNINVGNKVVHFKKTVPKNMATAGTITGLVIQAIKHIGKDHITSEHMQRLKQRLSNEDINTLKSNAYFAPAWIAKLIKSELIGG